MIRVRVRFCAVFREATNTGSLAVETSAGTAADLFREMMQRFDGLAHEPSALVAANDEMVSWEYPLNDGDEILFFPPVAGG